MQRIEEDGGLFINGNPATSTLGTIMTADWANAVQEEIAGTVEGLGLVLEPDDNGQLFEALLAVLNFREGHPYLANDWCYLDHRSGLILQWGETAVAGAVTIGLTGSVTWTATLPKAFTVGGLIGFACGKGGNDAAEHTITVVSITPTTIQGRANRISGDTGGDPPFVISYFVIGK